MKCTKMPTFECNLCKKIFTLKSDLERHKKKKTPCIPADQLIETFKNTIIEQVTNEVKSNMTTEKEKKEIEGFLKKCHDILRDNEGIVTMDALNNLSMLLFLRLINNHVKDGTIDLMEIKKYRSVFPTERDNLIQYVLFENIIENGVFKIETSKLPETIEFIFKAILWHHPKTKELFKDRYPQIKNKSTYETIFKMMSKIAWDEMQSDIKGMAYELFLSSELTGGDLGQFFTKREVIDYIVNELDPEVDETFIDPAMGTCGFITRMYNKVKHKYIEQNIPLNQNKVNEIMNGVEKNPGTTLLGLNNCLITTGFFPKNVIHGDSIRNYNNIKYDIVVSNPPFGIKGLKYEELPSDYNNVKKEMYLPIKSNDAVCLFLQAIYHMVKEGGKAAIIIPNGQQMNSSKNKTFIELRKMLIEKCNLYKIVKLARGTFLPYTGVETMILFFQKGGNTKNIDFYSLKNDYISEEKIASVKYLDLKDKNYSLNHKLYCGNKITGNFELDIETFNFGDIFNLEKGKIQSTKMIETVNGTGKFITKGNFDAWLNIKANECNLDGPNLFFGTSFNGNGIMPIRYYEGLCTCSNLISVVKPTNEYKNKILMKFYYYYFSFNRNFIEENYGKGACNISLDITIFKDFQIPVPPIQTQQKIITELDAIYNTIEECNKQIRSLGIQAKETLVIHLKSCKNDNKDNNVDNQTDKANEEENDDNEEEMIEVPPKKMINKIVKKVVPKIKEPEEEMIEVPFKKMVKKVVLNIKEPEEEMIEVPPKKMVKKVIKKVIVKKVVKK